MSDPKVEAAIAAGRVPSDITASYLNETRDRPAIIAILFVSILTSVVFFGRCASRIIILKRFGWDDALALFSWLIFIPFVGLCIELIVLGSGRHYAYIQYVLDLATVNVTEELDFYAHILYTTSLLICRMSGLALYAFIAKTNFKFTLAIRMVAGLIVSLYIPQLFLIIFHCLPVTALWPYDWQPEINDYTCITWGIVYSVNSSVSLISDIFLYGVPVMMIWKLKMPPKRKVQLACILLPGSLVIAISIVRLVLVIQGQWLADMSWSYNPMLAVETSEIGATLISLSIPGIKPAFDKYILKSDVKSTGNSSKPSSEPKATALLQIRSTPSHMGSEHHLISSDPVSFCDVKSIDSKEAILIETKC